jgi:type VI protein secretion system component Hcp
MEHPDICLQLSGGPTVEGECENPDGAILVNGFDLGMAAMPDGRVINKELTILKGFDSASPALLQTLSGSSNSFGQAVLSVWRLDMQSGIREVAMRFTFGNVQIATVDWDGRASDGGTVETVVLRYATLQVEWVA